MTVLASAFRGYVIGYSGLSKKCWQGIIAGMISSMFAGAFYFLTIYFVNYLHLNIKTSGFIISFYGMGAIAGGYLGGRLSDKFTPLPVSIISLLIRAIIFLLLTKISDVYLLASALLILGVSSYSFITSIQLFVLGECHHNEPIRLKAINILSVASNLGLGVSATFIAIFAKYGFHFIFSFCSFVLLMLSIYLTILNKRIHKPYTPNHSKSKLSTSTNTHWKNKKLVWLILICLLLSGSIVAQHSTTYSVYVHDKFSELGIHGFSMLFTLNTILVILLQIPLVNYFGQYNKLQMVGYGGFALGFGMFLISISNIYLVAIIACVIYTLGEMLFFSIANLICYQNAPQNKQGHQLGLYRMTYASSRVVGPITGGAIYHHFGANLLWYVCGIIGLLCLLACKGYSKLIDSD
jgi:MFS family permease